MSGARFRTLLKRKGDQFSGPKYGLGHFRDKKVRVRAGELLDKPKKSFRDDCALVFVDETNITLDPPLRACWMKRGQQRRIPATRPGAKQKRPIFGGYNWLEDTITWTTAGTKNSLIFTSFLEGLLVKQIPKKNGSFW